MMGMPIGRDLRKDGVFLSTIYTGRMQSLAWYGAYETAVSIDEKPWRIIVGYDTEAQATEGHKKYMAMSKEELAKLDYIG